MCWFCYLPLGNYSMCAKCQILVTKVVVFTIRVRALLMSSSTWHHRRMDNIFLTIKKSCHPRHAKNEKLCIVQISLCTPRKWYNFAEYQTFVREMVGFGLRSLLGRWSCHLLHCTNEGWITFSWPRILSTTNYKLEIMLFSILIWLSSPRKSCNFVECQILVMSYNAFNQRMVETIFLTVDKPLPSKKKKKKAQKLAKTCYK